jgi:ABC-type uncharacterized transport system permease subunit
MSGDQASSAVTLSAFVVAGIYGYRKLVETNHTSAPTAHFVIGFGFTFIILALIAQGAPALGGMLAILIATGDLLINGIALTKDLSGALNATKAATS